MAQFPIFSKQIAVTIFHQYDNQIRKPISKKKSVQIGKLMGRSDLEQILCLEAEEESTFNNLRKESFKAQNLLHEETNYDKIILKQVRRINKKMDYYFEMSAKIIDNSEEITNRQLNYNKKKQHQIAKEKRKAERKMN